MSVKTATLDKPKSEPTPRARRGVGGKFAKHGTAPIPALGDAPEEADEPEDNPEIESEPVTPARLVNGLKVMDVEPVFTGLKARVGQARIALRNTVILVLEDGSRVYSCVDCDFADAARGVVMRHRGDTHGQNLGGWTNRRSKAEITAAGNGKVDKQAMTMTLGDVLELGSKLDAYAVVIERQEERLAELRERAEIAERRLRVIAARLEKAGLVWASED